VTFRKLCLIGTAGLLWSGSPGYSQSNGLEVANGATVQVFGGKSPLVQVTDAAGKSTASIPIGKDPGRYIYSKARNTLYVVHNEKKEAHTISAVNLGTNRIDKEINVGSGADLWIFLSPDEQHLYCYTASKSIGTIVSSGGIGYLEGSLEPPYQPIVTVIDTSTNEVIATDNWLEDFRSNLPKHWILVNRILGVSNDGHLIVKTEADSRPNKPIKDKLIIFSGQSPRPALMIDLSGQPVASIFSKDDRLFLMAIVDGKPTAGTLVTVNLETGTTVSHTLTDYPTELLRIGSKRDLWILGSQDMRSVSESGELEDRRILLNKPRRTEGGDEGGDSGFLNGLPGETIALGEDHAAILINNKNGSSRHRVALLDLKNLEVDNIISTMSTGEQVGIRTDRILTAVLLSSATLGTVTFIPNLILRNEALAGRPDGQVLYTLDSDTHEVSVINVKTATVEKRLKVDNATIKLQVSSDNKYLYCFGKKTQKIDMDSNILEP